MKRRKFIAIAGAGGILAGLGVFGFTFSNAVERAIIDELSFLKLDKDGVSRFVADYTKSMSRKSKLMLKGYSFLGLSPQKSQKMNGLINAYLLSTDFFMNKMDESKVVKYVGLYNPYERPCAHPFSSAYYTA